MSGVLLRTDRRRAPGPAAALILGSGVVAVLVAVVEVAWLATNVGLGRVRDLVPYALVRGPFDAYGVDFAAALPAVMSRPFGLSDAGGVLSFTALAVVANLLLFWALAALGLPLVWALTKVSPPTDPDRSDGWLWPRAFPLFVLVGFALPGISAAVGTFLGDGHEAMAAGLPLGMAILVWAGLMGIFRRPERIARLFKVCVLASIVVTILALAGGAGAMILGPKRCEADQPAPPSGLPNILLVSIDSLRRDHVHCYGYPRQTSPTIDAVAQEGVLFETVASSTSWTLPAHVTLFTSLTCQQHGVIANSMRLGKDVISLPQVLWRAGYTTAGFVSGPYMQAEYGFARGFDHYDDYTAAKTSRFTASRGITSPKLVQLVQDWLAQWNESGRRRPFYIFLHMWDVHYDYTPPPPYDTLFDPDYRGTVTGEDFETGGQVHKNMNPRDLEHVIALYDGEIRFTDLHIGRVLSLLTDLGVFDETITVITADHGDEFFEHGRKGHKKALYDEALLVPLVIRFPPKVPMGKRVERMVRLMDVAPTIVSLAGLTPPTGFGAPEPKGPYAERDLTPLIVTGSTTTFPPLVAFGDLGGTLASLRTDRHKLIAQMASQIKRSLYDLSADPGERTNVIGRDTSLDATFTRTLFDWRDAASQPGRGMAQHFEPSEEHKERLRGLGYLK